MEADLERPMPPNPANDPVLNRCRAALAALYGDQLDRVVVFGSRARGDARPDSDHDVAVFPKVLPNRWNELRRLADPRVEFLAEADAELGIGLNDAAGQTADLAGFHPAQALISEWTGRAVKTHRGVQSECRRLTRADTSLDPDLRGSLSSACNLKAIADYDTGPDAEISPEEARDALASAQRFVAHSADGVAAPDKSFPTDPTP